MPILPRHMLQQAVAVSVSVEVCSLLQTCHEGEEPGEVIVRLRKHDILKVQRLSPTYISTTLFLRLLYVCPCQRVSLTTFRLMQDDLIGVANFVNACIRKMNPFEGRASDQPGVA